MGIVLYSSHDLNHGPDLRSSTWSPDFSLSHLAFIIGILDTVIIGIQINSDFWVRVIQMFTVIYVTDETVTS